MAYTVSDARADLDRIAADPVGGFIHRDTATALQQVLTDLEGQLVDEWERGWNEGYRRATEVRDGVVA